MNTAFFSPRPSLPALCLCDF